MKITETIKDSVIAMDVIDDTRASMRMEHIAEMVAVEIRKHVYMTPKVIASASEHTVAAATEEIVLRFDCDVNETNKVTTHAAIVAILTCLKIPISWNNEK